MAHRNLRDHESDGWERFDFPIICDSSLIPCVPVTRAGVDSESDTILTRQRTTPLNRWKLFRQRHGRKRPSVYISDQCTRGAECPFRHEMPSSHRLALRKAALLAKVSMGTLEPPEDKSIKTLLVRGLNSRIVEQDLRVQFGAYGEIESIRFLAEECRAFVTYTTREGAEKATQELSKGLVINGQRLKLVWARPQVPKSDQDSENQAAARCRFFLSQQQNQPPPMAFISSREVSVSSTSENNRASSSNFPIICDSSPNPCVRMTRAGVDSESVTILTPQRTTPLNRWNLFRQRNGRKRPSVYICDQCTRGAECPFGHEMPSQNINSHRLALRKAALLAKVSMGTLEPLEDKSIKTLLVRGLNSRIVEQDLRVQFGAYGEIESIRFLAEECRAFVTYTTREGAEKATQELSKGLVINGQRLKLAWARPQVPKSDQDSEKQAVARRRFFLSQQQSQPPPMAFISSREVSVSSTSESNGASSSYQMPPHQPYPP